MNFLIDVSNISSGFMNISTAKSLGQHWKNYMVHMMAANPETRHRWCFTIWKRRQKERAEGCVIHKAH